MTTRYKFTTAEAVEFIKSAHRHTAFAIHIRLDAPVADGSHIDNNHEYQDGCCGYTNLTRKEALRIVGDMLTKSMELRGGRIPMHEDTHDNPLSRRVVCWIG